MSKLLRCYVANYGRNDAWYDGVLLDFRKNGKPIHSIINLDNGGGKTTLLSFLFSVIDPRKDYFLKSRQNANHKISEYFSKNGVPGTCILEWAAPSTSNSHRIYVTGRSVHLRANQDVEDVMFCYFKESACAIEEFPGPNLGDNEPAMHWDGIQAWLTLRKKEQGMFQSSVQTSWFERLRADGVVDSITIRTQMKFSYTEGGVDSFVAFKSQEEFLQKFIELASSDEILDKVYQGVAEFKKKSENLPGLEKCNNEVLNAIQILTQLKTQHSAWTNQQTHVASAVQLLITLRGQIHGYFGHVDAAFTNASQAIAQLKISLAASNESLVTAEGNERYAAAVRAFATYRFNAAQLKTLDQAIAKKEDQIKHMDFLLLARKISEHVAVRQTLENEIASILHVQAPLRNRLEMSSTAFYGGLTQTLATQQQTLTDERTAQATMLARIKVSKQQVLDLTARIAKQTVKQYDAKQQLDAIASKQLHLEEKFRTPVEELGAFLQAAVHDLKHEQEHFSDALQLAQTQKYETSNAIREEAHVMSTLQLDLKQLNAWTDEQSSIANGYATNSMLCAIVDGVPDLNMPTLLGHIDDELARYQAMANQWIVQATKLRDRIERLENNKNEQHNRDTDTILAWMHVQGFAQAVPSAQYIASLSPAQRTVYLTDYPQGASGIFIHPEHVPDFIKKLATEPLPETFQHVWITTFTGSEVHPTNGLYFPLTNDADYDSDKARALLDMTRIKLIDLNAQQHAQEQRGQLLQRLRFNIEAYQKQYPMEKQEKTTARIAQVVNDLVAATQKHVTLTTLLNELTALTAQYQADLLKAKREAQANTPPMEKALRWLLEEHSRIASLNETIIATRTDAAQAQLDMTTAEEQQQLSETALDQSKDRTRAMERLHQDTKTERNGLEMVNSEHCTSHAKGDGTLDYLRGEYQRYLDEWRMTSAEHVSATQQVLLSNCKTEIAKLEKDQQPFVVVGAADLGLDASVVSENEKEKTLSTLSDDKRKYQALDVQTMIAHRDHMAHQREKILDADAVLEASTAARIHYQAENALRQHQEAVKKFNDQLAAMKEDSGALREKVHQVKILKDVFDGSVNEIECPPCKEIIENLDITLWTSQRDAALNEYRSQKAECTTLLDSRDASYRKYDNYRALHPGNLYLLAQNHQDPSLLLDDATLAALLVELGDISASMSSDIEKYQSDQSSVVAEMVTHTSALTVLLEAALAQKVPQGAPVIGGMHVLRIKSEKTPFSSIGNAERVTWITALLNDYLIDAKKFPANSRELFGHAIVAIYAKPLDFQILKMVENEKERYSLVHQVKNSGAEGVTMALCLYMTILSIRNKPEKSSNTRDAGVLLIDNPFAKATTNIFWTALHKLADHYRVQFVFLTASSDPEMLRNFRHYIALTKKLDTVTGRRILTPATITFTEKEVLDGVVNVV